jgi:hypothetical protein
MLRLPAYVIIVLACAVTAIFLDPNSVPFTLATGAAIGFLVPVVDAIATQWTLIRIYWYSVISWRDSVRVSAAYIFRIKVDRQYLLVHGNRFDQYQPVGGVYKFHDSALGVLSALSARDDDLIPLDGASRSDLRLRLPGKHLAQFARWFESETNREFDGWREFHEELIQSDILPAGGFEHVAYDRIRRYYHPLRRSEYAQSKELIIADIFELLPTDTQLRHLRDLMKIRDTRWIWADEEQIVRRGAVPGQKQLVTINEPASWIV